MPDDVALRIGNRDWKHWDQLGITLNLDSYDTAAFLAPFDSDRSEVRDTFRPFSYQEIDLKIDGEQVFSGTMLAPQPTRDDDGTQVEVSAYSLPGVLANCMPQASAYPLEFERQTLRQILESLCAPFGVRLKMSGNPGEPFERFAIEPGETVWDKAVELAQQRSRILSSTPDGELEVLEVTAGGAPVVAFDEDEEPFPGVTIAQKPEEFFSEITGFAETKSGRDGGSHTERNPFAPAGLVRPKSLKLQDADGDDLVTAVKAELGRMIANAFSVEIQDLVTWRTPAGNLWAPGQLVSVRAPSLMVYEKTTFMIRTVTLNKSSEELTAGLSLTLPGCFTGTLPDSAPWLG